MTSLFDNDGTPTPTADKDTERSTGTEWRETSQGRRAAVLRLLKDGGWVSTSQLCDPSVGGNEGTRRLREVREVVRSGAVRGWKDIEKRKREGSTQFEYRLTSAEGFAPRPAAEVKRPSPEVRAATSQELAELVLGDPEALAIVRAEVGRADRFTATLEAVAAELEERTLATRKAWRDNA